jgi:hypothetical protein
MTKFFDKTEMQRFLVSAVGALAVSTTCIFAAVGPAKAASPAPMSAEIHQLAAK